MTLDQYLAAKRMTNKAFGALPEVALTEATVSRIRRGKLNTPIDTLRRIAAATDDAVTVAELIATRVADDGGQGARPFSSTSPSPFPAAGSPEAQEWPLMKAAP